MKTETKWLAIGFAIFGVILVILQFFVGWKKALELDMALLLVIAGGACVFAYFTTKPRNLLCWGIAIWAWMGAVAIALNAFN